MLKLHNSLTRQLEDFIPRDPPNVNLYTCGPTVYNYAHIGNLRTFIFEDILRRWLQHESYSVRQVKNLTDIDDKIIKASQETKEPISLLTTRYVEAFFQDLETLQIEKAEAYPRATDHVPQMICLINELLTRGYAYQKPSGVYFRAHLTEKFDHFVDSSNLEAGASGRVDTLDKENPEDFALWKAWTSDDGDTYWISPFGKGKPGWHCECSAMLLTHLTTVFGNTLDFNNYQTVDIHTGGIDLQFPHHQCEIAQTQACTGKPYVKYWLHAAHLLVNGQKMSKSLDNFYTLRDLPSRAVKPPALAVGI